MKGNVCRRRGSLKKIWMNVKSNMCIGVENTEKTADRVEWKNTCCVNPI